MKSSSPDPGTDNFPFGSGLTHWSPPYRLLAPLFSSFSLEEPIKPREPWALNPPATYCLALGPTAQEGATG